MGGVLPAVPVQRAPVTRTCGPRQSEQRRRAIPGRLPCDPPRRSSGRDPPDQVKLPHPKPRPNRRGIDRSTTAARISSRAVRGGVFSRYGLAREDRRGRNESQGHPFIHGVSVRRGEKIFRVPAMAATFMPAVAKGKDAPTCGARFPVHDTRARLGYRPGGPTTPPKPARIPAASRGSLLARSEICACGGRRTCPRGPTGSGSGGGELAAERGSEEGSALADVRARYVGAGHQAGLRGLNETVGRNRDQGPVRVRSTFILFFFYSFSLLFSNLGFKFKFCTQFILKSYCESKVQILEIFLDIYIFYIISLVLIIIP
jgi:hypothetical protein